MSKKTGCVSATAQGAVGNANDAFRRHLDVKTLSAEEVLAAINPRRKILGLLEIKEFTADTSLNAGVSEGSSQPAFNKQSALRDVVALEEAQAGFSMLGKNEVAGILKDLTTLQTDPALLEAITRRSFVERGLALVEGGLDPIRQTGWLR